MYVQYHVLMDVQTVLINVHTGVIHHVIENVLEIVYQFVLIHVQDLVQLHYIQKLQ